MTDRAEHEVLVAGTGPIGMISALAFADAGFDTAIVGPPVAKTDGRTTAIMQPALRYLDSLGLGPALEHQGEPLRTMRIIDATSRLVRSPTVTFQSSELDLPAFGRNIANADLNGALAEAMAMRPRIRRIEGLVEEWTPGPQSVAAIISGGTNVSARLVVAADGRNSPARSAARIAVDERPTGQTAIVLSFAHTRPHGGISTEFHTESGPFTQVPLPGNRSSLVWVVRSADVSALLATDSAELGERIERQMQSMLGRVTVETVPQAYPLVSSRPRSYAARRIALVGEAAHIFPPIGAQGLNLGIRDVEALVDVSRRNRSDPAAPSALAAYEAKRRPDIALRSGAVGLLNRSLLSDLLPAQVARGVMFEALRTLSPLRSFFMREGMKPGTGLRSALSVRTRNRLEEGRT